MLFWVGSICDTFQDKIARINKKYYSNVFFVNPYNYKISWRQNWYGLTQLALWLIVKKIALWFQYLGGILFNDISNANHADTANSYMWYDKQICL